MNFDDYQLRAKDTDKLSSLGGDTLKAALFGLAGETGSVHTLYKKKLRDGDQFPGFKSQVKEELGDILWYLTTIASHENLSLTEIATENLEKIHSRWLPTGEDDHVEFDSHFPVEERLPRRFTAEFRPEQVGGVPKIAVYVDGKKCGSTLNDNAYETDGYRFHDIFHMTCVAFLGWSPVVRALMNRKRKSEPEVDEVEDGGRAIATDEALAAVVFIHAVKQNYFEDIRVLDSTLLNLCYELSAGLEVGKRSRYEWETTILKAFELWRYVQNNNGGTILFDMTNRTAEVMQGIN